MSPGRSGYRIFRRVSGRYQDFCEKLPAQEPCLQARGTAYLYIAMSRIDDRFCRKVCPLTIPPRRCVWLIGAHGARSQRNRSSGASGKQVQQQAAWPASIARVRGKRVAPREPGL